MTHWQHPDIDAKVCLTAQHRDMQSSHADFEINADVDLNLMTPGQNLHDLTARMLSGLRPVLLDMKPDVVLVHGDTATTLAATLAAFYLQIPVGHVEAGLRTGDLSAPFPEEANRVLADKLCRFHFAPAEDAANSSKRRTYCSRSIFVGNTVIDALLWMRSKLSNLTFNADVYLSAAPLFDQQLDRQMVLITDTDVKVSVMVLTTFARPYPNLPSYPDVAWVYPVHLNPNVLGPVNAKLSNIENVHLIPPLNYPNFVRLMDRSTLILTDSGGIQEEAPSLNKPTLVMRETTERPEGIHAGVVRLVGADFRKHCGWQVSTFVR